MTKGRPLGDHEVRGTLVDCLTPCADGLRQLYTDFGLRPYRVFLVWIAWTADEDLDGMLQDEELDLASIGPDPQVIDPETNFPVILADVGVGSPRLIREVEVLPTPRQTGLTGVGKSMDAMGLTERGGVTIDQISSSFSEDVLMGLIPGYRDPECPDSLKEGLDFFWEIRDNRPAGYVTPGFEGCTDPTDQAPPRRRYHVVGVPERQPDVFQWVVALTRADGERGRKGEVEAIDSAAEVEE